MAKKQRTRSHNPKVTGSNPVPATTIKTGTYEQSQVPFFVLFWSVPHTIPHTAGYLFFGLEPIALEFDPAVNGLVVLAKHLGDLDAGESEDLI